MIETFRSRSGSLSARIGGVALHSPYDPAREARRFVEESLRGDRPGTVVLLGEGLGYAGRATEELFPQALLVSVGYSAEAARVAVHRPKLSWSPGPGQPLGAFLRGAIGEIDVEGLRVIEWPASARLFPQASREANRVVREVVRELNGSCATTISAGRLWLRNCVANFVSLDGVLAGAPCGPNRPIVIAASGPRLRAALPALRRLRPRFDLWALPSAVACLESAGLGPDLVPLTDPGHWAMAHLRFRGAGALAMPLSACRGARLAGGVFLLDQALPAEQALLAAAAVAAPAAAPHGTVAATALELALASTSAPVVLAGLDLCSDDILDHALPNSFDVMLATAENRLLPRYSASYARARAGEASSAPGPAGRVRVSRSLETYAGWLSDRARSASGRVFRLLPSPIDLPGAAPLDERGLDALLRGLPQGAPGLAAHLEPRWPPRAARISLAAGLLGRWQRSFAGGLGPEAPAATRDLAWDLCARELIEARRRGREGDARGARDATAAAWADAAAFLGALRERLEQLAEGAP